MLSSDNKYSQNTEENEDTLEPLQINTSWKSKNKQQLIWKRPRQGKTVIFQHY